QPRPCRAESLCGLTGQSPPPVVPQCAGRAVLEVLAPVSEGLPQHPQMLSQRIEMRLTRGGHQRMPVQNQNFLPSTPRQSLQSVAEFKLFSRIQLLAEPTQFAKHLGLAKDKRACRPALRPADHIPDGDEQAGPSDRAV